MEMFSGSESLSLSFPPCTVGTVEAAHPPVAASDHSAQGRTRAEGEALADTGPGAQADSTSLDLYFFDPWGWK